MRRLSLIILAVLSITFSEAQNWQWVKKFGTHVANLQVKSDAADNSFVTGISTSTTVFENFTISKPSWFLAKFSPTGACLWLKEVEGDGVSANVTSHGEIILHSYINEVRGNFTTYDLVIQKISVEGTVLWRKSFAKNFLVNHNSGSLASDNSGNIYFIGNFTGTATFQNSAINSKPDQLASYIGKMNASGNILWAKKVADAFTRKAVLAPNGNIFIVGDLTEKETQFEHTTVEIIPELGNYFAAEYTPNGNFQRVQKLGVRYKTSGCDIALAENRIFVVITHNYGDAVLHTFDNNFAVISEKGVLSSHRLQTEGNMLYIGGANMGYNYQCRSEIPDWCGFVLQHDISGNCKEEAVIVGRDYDHMNAVTDFSVSNSNAFIVGHLDTTGTFRRTVLEGSSGKAGSERYFGRFNFSALTSVSNDRNLKGIGVFPNPGNGTYTISCNTLSNVELKVVNLQGQVIMQENTEAISNEHKLVLKDCAKGIYILELVAKEGEMQTKLVVE